MILWILALVLLGLLGMIGFYQGAVRAAMSFIGLVVAAAVATPLGHLISPILKLVGIKHPVWLMILGPLIAFLVVLTIVKTSAQAVHRKIDTHYKYQDSETKRMLFERLNQRLGLCVGLMNATVYVFLIAILFYPIGYFTVQAATSEKDVFSMKLINKVASDTHATSFDKAIGPFVPAKESYFDAVDVLGDVFHNPLLQNRLATYPPFLPLAEQTEFADLGKDLNFQQLWAQGPSFNEFKANQKAAAVLDNPDLFTNVVGTVNGDFKDLKTYLETGKSEKYADEKIIGRWDIDIAASINAARKAKPNMTLAELRLLRRNVGAMKNAKLVAYLDNRARLQIPTGANKVQNLQGTWKPAGGNSYKLTFTEGKKSLEVPARIEGPKLAVTKDNATLLFEK